MAMLHLTVSLPSGKEEVISISSSSTVKDLIVETQLCFKRFLTLVAPDGTILESNDPWSERRDIPDIGRFFFPVPYEYMDIWSRFMTDLRDRMLQVDVYTRGMIPMTHFERTTPKKKLENTRD